MPAKSLLCIFFISAMPLLATAQQFDPSDADYLWPTNASMYLTSTFGETRTAHFHSALDIKTWGREGYDVYATRNGVVDRVVIGPDGYGKAIYLRHADNSYSVYAHLQQFSEPIQQAADSIRIKDYSFNLDAWIRYQNIEVKKGDRIGYSGSTGIGPPHLHFELRTPTNEPFNPLKTNLDIKDTVAPHFQTLSVEPLSIHSRIEGKSQLLTHPLNPENDSAADTLHIQGPIGLGVDVADKANDVPNTYAVYELKMYVDDTLYFHSKLDRFSFLNSHQMYIDRIYSLLESTGDGFQKLYVEDANTLPFYQDTGYDGTLDLPSGTHKVTIEAMDYFGNSTEEKLVLSVSSQQSGKEPTNDFDTDEKRQYFNWSPNNWNWFAGWVNIPADQFHHIAAVALGNNTPLVPIHDHNQVQLSLDEPQEIFFRGSGKQHFISRKINKDSPTYVTSTTDNSFIRFPENTFYRDQHAGLMVQPIKKDSLRIEIIPSSIPTKSDFDLSIALDSTQQQLNGLGIYRYNSRKDTLSFVESSFKAGYRSAEVDKLGTYYLLADTTAPILQDPKLRQWENGQWVIIVDAVDNRSGIDYKTAKGFVDGERGIMEYDPEEGLLIYYHPHFVPKEEQELTIEVNDYSGNTAKATFGVWYSKTE